MDKCRGCGDPLTPMKGRGRPKVWCSEACRLRTYRGGRKRLTPPLRCAECEKRMSRNPSSLPQGSARCLECRRAAPKQIRRKCSACGKDCWGERCRSCVLSLTAGPDAEKRRVLYLRRAERERLAPGLSISQRHALLAQWKRQGRRCTYCLVALVEQVDHVIPLALGGTNREGNLTPACGSCNARKNDSLLSEWRHKRRAQRERLAVDVENVKPRPPVDYSKRVCKIYFGTCETCDTPWSSRSPKTRMCSTHRGWPPIRDRVNPCMDCATPVSYVTRPVKRCPPCQAAHHKDRERMRRRARRKVYGKGPCAGCGGPRWGKTWCQSCYADMAGGGIQSSAA